MRFTSRAVVGASLLALSVFAGPGMAQTAPGQDLLALSREARTTRDHAELARRFRLQAEEFDATAAAHEARAKKLFDAAPTSVKKWPHITMPDVTRAKSQAMEARRAARESRELSEHHTQRAVESLGDSAQTGA